jgi:ribose transport system permease protein
MTTTSPLAQRDGSATTSDSSLPAAAPRKLRLPDAFVERYAVVFVLIALVVVFSILKSDTFFTVANLQAVLTTQAALLIMAVALTVSLATNEFDLSIGGVAGLSAVMVAKVGASHGAAAGFLAALAVCLAVGVVHSVAIVLFRANSFIVTLAMGTVTVAVAEGVSGSTTLGGVPTGIVTAMSKTFLGVGLPFWYAVILAVVIWVFLEHTPTGRYVFFTGEGRQAAALAGIRVDRIRVLGLFLTPLGAGLAGLVLAGQSSAANSGMGEPHLLTAFAACFLGAATIKASRFNVIGTIIAALLLAVGTTGLQLFGFPAWITDLFDGAVLVVAITVASIVSKQRSR